MSTKKIFSCLGFGIILLAFAVALGNANYVMRVFADDPTTTSSNNTASGHFISHNM